MIITKTPLRISLLGGNTDFPKYFKKNGGLCITATIDKYVYCILKERFDKEIWINYSEKEKVKRVEDIKHNLVREAMKLVGVNEGVEITFLSDIPSEGSGLGSSSAVTIGLLNALHHYKNEVPTQMQLAEECCRIERNILKNPIGMQDQFAIASGGSNLIKFHGKTVTVFKLNIDFERNMMLFYTGKTRNANSILSKMKLNKKILDRTKFLAQLGVLASDDYYAFSSLLNTYWELKKKLNKSVSDKAIDKMYKKALRLGATGGKIIGAGGGGFLFLLAPVEDQEHIRRNLGLKELPFKLSKYGSEVIFNING